MPDVRYASPRFNGLELDVIYQSLKNQLAAQPKVNTDVLVELLVRVRTYIELDRHDD
jgi:hypothetical protein